ncbi:MAG: hypothetical protein R6V04_01580 [bacterium]
MVCEIDPLTAYIAATVHEIEGLLHGQSLAETLMDLHNNTQGTSGKSADELLNSGQLRVINKEFENRGTGGYPWIE